MKILFWGGTGNNVGPDNINRGIIANASNRFRTVTSTGKYRQLGKALGEILRCDVVVVSCVGLQHCILMGAAKLLGRKTVYLMHGCAEQEFRLNGISPGKWDLAREVFLWDHADRILTVSRRYMLWFREQYPRYEDKLDYVYNGVEKTLFDRAGNPEKIPGSVAVSGGLTPLKNNRAVIRAVEALEGKAGLWICGNIGQGIPEQYRYVHWAGDLPHEAFLDRLSRTELFVVNSLLESFSIAAVEALACGCSLLISERAGVADLLALEETDILHDPMDVEELRGKISYLLEHPNGDRLRRRFDPEEWSFAAMAEKLVEKCEGLLRHP